MFINDLERFLSSWLVTWDFNHKMYGIPVWWAVAAAIVAFVAAITVAVKRYHEPVVRLREAKATVVVRVRCKYQRTPYTTARWSQLRKWLKYTVGNALSGMKLDFNGRAIEDQVNSTLQAITGKMENEYRVDVKTMYASVQQRWKVHVYYRDS